MIDWITNNLLLTGSGASAIIFILIKIVHNRTIAFFLFGKFKTITDMGRFKFGIKFWRTVRIWVEDTVIVVINSIFGGLGYYDLIEAFKKKGAEMTPPKRIEGLKWNPESKKVIPFFEGEKVANEDIYELLMMHSISDEKRLRGAEERIKKELKRL